MDAVKKFQARWIALPVDLKGFIFTPKRERLDPAALRLEAYFMFFSRAFTLKSPAAPKYLATNCQPYDSVSNRRAFAPCETMTNALVEKEFCLITNHAAKGKLMRVGFCIVDVDRGRSHMNDDTIFNRSQSTENP